jgi:putative ABC transport system substrate-binding protein
MAGAQQAVPVVGILYSGTAEGMAPQAQAFRTALSELGYIEGRNIAFEYRLAETRPERLPALAKDLVERRVAVIVVAGGSATAVAAKNATSTIPIVFAIGTDPVSAGLVTSFNRPGANLTGVTVVRDVLRSKQVQLLRAIAPRAAGLALLVDPENPNAEANANDMGAAARVIGWTLKVFKATTDKDFETTFAAMAEQKVGALLVQDANLFNSHQARVAALAAGIRVPALSTFREFPAAGGLLSYGASRTDSGRQMAIYTSRILKGEKPGDLPIARPTRFELVINLRTAKALQIEVAATLLALADEVIE